LLPHNQTNKKKAHLSGWERTEEASPSLQPIGRRCHWTFSCPVPPSLKQDELHLTDGSSYNYNCQVIPLAVLKTILKHPKLASEARETDADSGLLSGLVFVSERENNLETLHVALRFNGNPPKVKVFSLADIYGTNSFNIVRLEDSGCIGGGYKVSNHTIVRMVVGQRGEVKIFYFSIERNIMVPSQMILQLVACVSLRHKNP
jgi:hypothetical protein